MRPDGGAAVEFHVLPYGQQWALTRDGEQMGVFETKQQTIEEACRRARAEELSSIVVHDSHGQVQRKRDADGAEAVRDSRRPSKSIGNPGAIDRTLGSEGSGARASS